MDWLGLIADIIGISSAVFALFAWQESRKTNELVKAEKQRQNREIKVVLHSDRQDIELPFELRRIEFTRAEVQGRIGMIPMKQKGKRYSIAYLNDPEFLHRINQIADSYGDATLEILCSEEEINQFDISKGNNWFRFGR
ncbi:MAG: hypothetical protein ACFBSF_18230 [Leptolyngbyaceae cyanobacterium]